MKKSILISVLILGLNSILPIVSEVEALTKTERIESVETRNNEVLGRVEWLAKSDFVNLKEVKILQDETKLLLQKEKETSSLATKEKRQELLLALEKLEKARMTAEELNDSCKAKDSRKTSSKWLVNGWV